MSKIKLISSSKNSSEQTRNALKNMPEKVAILTFIEWFE